MFEDLWRRMGLSVDWTRSYATIDERSRRASQRMFLRNLARGEAYSAEAPTLWDVDYQTAVAQAEMEDKERTGAYHRLRFDDIEIDTTRPELLAACVALVAHPDDERFVDRFGTTVHTPLFGVEVPILAHPLADPEKGSGIAMICTFGDVTDVIWWRELHLPTRSIITRAGRITDAPPPGVPDGPAWRAIAGLTVKAAQRTMVELLTESGDLIGEPRPITHPVKFYERGERPLEIVTSRQWYIRNGGRDAPLRQALLGARRRAAVAPALHAGALRQLGQRAQQRLAGQPPALLRRPGPGVVSRSAPTAWRTTNDRSCPTRPACPSTRRPMCLRATTPTSAAGRAASWATPTSWTPGPPRR